MASSKKKRSPRSTPRRPSQHAGGQQLRASRLRSRFLAARKWIIGAVLAGLAASISAVIVNLTQTSLSPLTAGLSPTYQPPRNGPSQNVNAASGPILAVQTTEGWYSLSCFPPGAGWVFPVSSTSVISAAPGRGIKHGAKAWDQNPPAFGAVAASDIELSITASGSSQRAIVLTGIKFRVIRRRPPLKGILVTVNPTVNCSPASFQTGYVDLDTSPPTVMPPKHPSSNASSAGGVRTAPLMFPYTISESDPEGFILTISTRHFDCMWTAELDWVAGSEVGHTLIEDNGHPFETTATTALRTVTWVQNGNGWSRTSPSSTAVKSPRPTPSISVRPSSPSSTAVRSP